MAGSGHTHRESARSLICVEIPHTRELRLTDGRRLTFAEFGDPNGRPLLYCHGSPSSRLEPLLVGDAHWRVAGLRVISPDRPGIGGSDPRSDPGFAAWSKDAAELLDALSIERCSVFGNSGSAPYAIACGARIAHRVNQVVVVAGGWRMDWPEARSGLPLPNRLMLTLAHRAPWLLGPLLSAMGGIASDPAARDAELASLARRVPVADAAAFALPGVLEAFGATMRHALLQGGRRVADELALYTRPFDFDPAEVRIPVRWHHGQLDTNAPIALARRAVKTLPSAVLIEHPGEAHLSTLVRCFEESVAILR